MPTAAVGTVLVVEDDPINRKLMQVALSLEGWSVELAADGAKALAAAQRVRPDVIVQDLRLPDIGGVELTAALREVTDAPIVALSGYDEQLIAVRHRDMYAAYLSKPVAPASLSLQLRELLGAIPGVSTASPPEDDFAGRPIAVAGRDASQDSVANADAARLAAARLSAVAGAAETLARSRTVREVLPEVFARYRDISGARGGAVFVLGPSGQLELAVCEGESSSVSQLPAMLAKVPTLAPVLATGELAVVDESSSASSLLAVFEATELVLVPLLSYGSVVGLVVLAGGAGIADRGGTAVAKALQAQLGHALTFERTIDQLAESERRFRWIADAAAQGLVLVSRVGTIAYANRVAARCLGLEPGSLMGRSADEIFQTSSDSGAWEETHEVDGEQRLIAVEATVQDPRASAAEGFTVLTVRDLTAQRRRERELWSLATTDPLTGLHNRRYFDDVVQRELTTTARYGDTFSLCYLDLDGFKGVNDRLGHAAGDELLKAVADAIDARCRASDIAARLGGDEFAVLLRHTPRAAAERFIDALRLVVEETGKRVTQEQVTVGVSVGLVFVPEDACEAHELLQLADERMYADKRRRRSQSSGS